MTLAQLSRLGGYAGLSVAVGLLAADKLGVASIIIVDGCSMQPTFNPSCGNRNQDLAKLLQSREFSREALTRELKGRCSRDRIMLNRWVVNDKRNLQVGDVVIFTSPKDPNESMIKRIAAMPGDVIYLKEADQILEIQEGYCWVEGDNHGSSYDSNNFGPIPLDLIEGRVSLIVWPPKRIRRIHTDPSISSLSTKTSIITRKSK